MLRPQEISNHPEVIGRLGCLAMNGMIDTDIYGNVDSTHVRAVAGSGGKHTPHLLAEALSWHVRHLDDGSMRPTPG